MDSSRGEIKVQSGNLEKREGWGERGRVVHFFLMFLSGYLIVALGDEQENRNIALVNLFAMFFMVVFRWVLGNSSWPNCQF